MEDLTLLMMKVSEGLWTKCPQCGEILQTATLKIHFYVCQQCFHHFRISAPDRVISLVGDQKKNFQEWDRFLVSTDPLEFHDKSSYAQRLKSLSHKAEEAGSQYPLEAILTGRCLLEGTPFGLGVFDFSFLGGSMGPVVGEKIARLFDACAQENLPVVIFSQSGGARMHEGILSLMQMAKTVAALNLFKKKKAPFISVLTDPTTGGVAASFALLGDIVLAEPKALVGFAGPRVIQQSIREELPQGFQAAESILKHGFIDQIVARSEYPQVLSRLFKFFSL